MIVSLRFQLETVLHLFAAGASNRTSIAFAMAW
jgi:hypothetical protein